jgi:hypothetical protein
LKGFTTAPKKPPKLHARKKRRRPSKRLSAGGSARPRKKRRVNAVGGEGTLEELLYQLTKTGQEENARAAETAVAEKKKKRAQLAAVAKRESDEKRGEITAFLRSSRAGP